MSAIGGKADIALDQANLSVAVRVANAPAILFRAKKSRGPGGGPCHKAILVFRRGTTPIIVIEDVFRRLGESLHLRDRTHVFRLRLLWQLVNEVIMSVGRRLAALLRQLFVAGGEHLFVLEITRQQLVDPPIELRVKRRVFKVR